MQYAPTRIHEKPARFHISSHGYAKNLPDFTIPNKDTPKTHPILGANPCRRTFRGVCNTPLHGYMKNLLGFIFPHTDTPKTHPISPIPNKDTPKTGPILDPNLRRGSFRGVCFCALHGYTKNTPGFRPKPLARIVSGRMLLRPTRVHAKFGGFHIPAHDMARNPTGFGLCHTT